jgi:hypothetical protein
MYGQHRCWINISGLTQAPVSSAAPAVRHVPVHACKPVNRSVARDFAAGAQISRSSQAGRSNAREKVLSDYPRGLANSFWLGRFPAADSLPVPLALAVPSLFAGRRRTVSLLGPPPRPPPRCLLAPFTAIALARLARMKALLASLQQTRPHPRTPRRWRRPPGCSPCGMTGRILDRAHGR